MVRLFIFLFLAATLQPSSRVMAGCPDDGTPVSREDAAVSLDELFQETTTWVVTTNNAMEMLHDVLCAEERREEALGMDPTRRHAAAERARVSTYLEMLRNAFFSEDLVWRLGQADISFLLLDYDEAVAPLPTATLLRHRNAVGYAQVCHENLRRCIQELSLQLSLQPLEP